MITKKVHLVLEGLEHDSLETKAKVQAVLDTNPSLQTIELDKLLSAPGSTMIYPQDSEDEKNTFTSISALYSKLRRAGAKVQLVEDVHKHSSQLNSTVDTFTLFYQKYTKRLAEIMQETSIVEVQNFVETLIETRSLKRQIFVLGNGGSASIASHFVNDLAKLRFPEKELRFRAVSLTEHNSFITATANDEGYENIFIRQLELLLSPGDLVVAISSSGNSENVLRAVNYANRNEAKTFSMVGFDGGRLSQISQQSIHIPSKTGQYGYAEDATMILAHLISIYLAERDQEMRELAN